MDFKAIIVVLRYFAIYAAGGAIALGVVFAFGIDDNPVALMAAFAVQAGYSLHLRLQL